MPGGIAIGRGSSPAPRRPQPRIAVEPKVLLAILVLSVGCFRAREPVPPSPQDQLRAMAQDGKWGYAVEGRTVIPPRFDEARPFSEGVAPVRVGNRWQFINANGNVAFNRDFDDARPFAEGLAAVREDGLWGYIDRTGEFRIKPQYAAARHFHWGLAAVLSGELPDSSGQRANDKWGYINKTGKTAITPQFDDAYAFSEGLARVNFGGRLEWTGKGKTAVLSMIAGGKWGYIDRTGKLVLPPAYQLASDFSEGLAAVMVDKRWGYVDKSGRFAVAPVFDAAYDFYGGRASVAVGRRDARLMVIDDRMVYVAELPGRTSVDTAPDLRFQER